MQNNRQFSDIAIVPTSFRHLFDHLPWLDLSARIWRATGVPLSILWSPMKRVRAGTAALSWRPSLNSRRTKLSQHWYLRVYISKYWFFAMFSMWGSCYRPFYSLSASAQFSSERNNGGCIVLQGSGPACILPISFCQTMWYSIHSDSQCNQNTNIQVLMMS